jgi:MOSC domain-containing protein YiiM
MINTAGIVTSLQRCPGYRKQMHFIEEAEVITNLGIKNDTHALPDSTRQVLLIEKETLDELHLQPGDVKENITTCGISLMELKSKARLQIGKEVILEITKSCSPCSRMEELRPGLQREIAKRRGMLARVIQGGTIRRGDQIQTL